MACNRRSTLLVALAALAAAPVHAQVKAIAFGVNYESPGLVVPVGLGSSLSGGHTWTLGLVGSTGTFEYVRIVTPARSLFVAAEATPWGANGSRYLYVGG